MRSAILVALLAGAAPVLAQITPSVSVGVVHTDNVRLTPTDGKDENIVFIEPSLLLAYEGERAGAAIDYRFQAFHFEDEGQTSSFHTYAADFNLDLIPEQFIIEAGASRFQSIRDLSAPIPANNLPISSNRVDRDDYYFNPYFQRRLGSTITAAGSFRQTWVEVEGNALQGNEQGNGRFSLDNYAAGQGFSWALMYDWQRAEYDVSEPFEYQRARLELGAWASSRTRFFVSGGLESDWNVPLDPALEAELWEVGVDYQLSADTRFLVAVGERSFGSSSRAILEYASRVHTVSLSFVQEPTTQGIQRFRRVTPSDPDSLEDVLTTQGQSQRFVSNRVDLDWRMALRRLTIRGRVFVEDRSDVTTAGGTVLPEQDQSSAALTVSYQLGARTRAGVQVTRLSFETSDGLERDIIRSGIDITYDIGARTVLAFNYSYNDQDAAGTVNNNAADFFSNVVTLTLTRTF